MGSRLWDGNTGDEQKNARTEEKESHKASFYS